MISEKTKPGIETAISLPGELSKSPSCSSNYNHKKNRWAEQAPLIPSIAVAAVQAARQSLMAGQFALDDAGLECEMLNRLHARAALLLGIWNGRIGIEPDLPTYIIEASQEWRFRSGRSY